MASCKVLWEFLTEAKTSVFIVKQRLYNHNIDAHLCNVRIILLVKIVNRYFERKESTSNAPLRTFVSSFVREKGCICQLIQSILQATQASIYLTWCGNGC